MRTVGQLLQQTRLSKRLELEDISKAIKIRVNFLDFIEKDDYLKLPNGAVARGFVANYSQYLGLNVETVQAMLRRDFSENQYGQIILRGMAEPVNQLNYWTPKKTVIASVLFGVLIFLSYLIYQYFVLIGPPVLTIQEPVDKQIVITDTIEVVGATDPQAVLSVNGQLVVLDKGGNFAFKLPINIGENKISIQSVGKSGKVSLVEKTVFLKND